MNYDKRLTKEQVDDFLNLFEVIDPKNKVFKESKKIAEKKKYDIVKKEFNNFLNTKGKR